MVKKDAVVVETVEQMVGRLGSKSKVMVELYDAGQSVSQISKFMGSHYSFVYGVIQRHTDGNIRETTKVTKSDEIRSRYDGGQSIGEIAKQLNSNYSYVFSVVKKHREKK